ncbi:MAG: energy transducer TonB [Pedobacter sp.]|nr:MAG: energy transducer TonB [Pedobacter sp.]
MKKMIFSSLIAVTMLGLCPKTTLAQDTEDKIYSFISMENPPTYPGGMANFYKFLSQNMKYPAEAVKNNVQGTVYISFKVEKNGAVSDIKVDRALGSGTDEEAIRVIKLAGIWNPGTVKGNPVITKYNIPVKFALNKKNIAPATPKQHTIGAVPNEDNKKYYFGSLENPPTFPGGVKAFYEFLSKNVKYPELAYKNGVQGNAYTSFTVEKDGSITDIKVDRKVGYGIDEEAVRVISLSPKWIPGSQNGQPIRVSYSIPIKFALENKAAVSKSK